MAEGVSVRDKMVFLSGPMSDDWETRHAHEFVDANIALKRAGAAYVYNPAVEWLREMGPERSHENYMRLCLRKLSAEGIDGPYFDMLVSLPMWTVSEGAKLEREVAEACGIPTYDITDLIPDWWEM